MCKDNYAGVGERGAEDRATIKLFSSQAIPEDELTGYPFAGSPI